MDFSSHSIIWILLIGLVIGAVAKLLMPGKDPGGCIITMLLGIAGAFLASYLGEMAGYLSSVAGSADLSQPSLAPWCSCCSIV